MTGMESARLVLVCDAARSNARLYDCFQSLGRVRPVLISCLRDSHRATSQDALRAFSPKIHPLPPGQIPFYSLRPLTTPGLRSHHMHEPEPSANAPLRFCEIGHSTRRPSELASSGGGSRHAAARAIPSSSQCRYAAITQTNTSCVGQGRARSVHHLATLIGLNRKERLP